MILIMQILKILDIYKKKKYLNYFHFIFLKMYTY